MLDTRVRRGSVYRYDIDIDNDDDDNVGYLPA